MHFPSLGDGNLQRRFVLRVLMPPFLALLLLSLLGFWQLDKQLRRQAVSDLNRSAETVSTKLDREFAIRETVLRRTGEELIVVKSVYQANKKKLDENRDSCRNYIKQKSSYVGAPGGVCDPFLDALVSGGSKLQIVEDQYVKNGETLGKNQSQRINERLGAFKQFFPETLALMLVDENGQIVSSALSGAFKGSTDTFQADAKQVVGNPILGRLHVKEGFELAVFGYPIPGGAVLVAYDINHPSFIKTAWESAPIDRTTTTAVILDSRGELVYPDLKNGNPFQKISTSLRVKPYEDVSLRGVVHMSVGAEVGQSKWLVVVASPKAAVLKQLRDAQLTAVIVLGLLIAGFMWIGTYFMQHIIRNIDRLVRGANAYGSGKLTHRIEVDDSGGEELEQLANTMNEMAEHIDASEKERDEKNKEFISIATHELRSPLSAIIGYVSMFKEKHDSKLDKESKAMIDEVHYGTSRLRDLVNDMLSVARLEGGKSDTKIVPIDIDAMTKNIVKSMSVVADEAKVRLSYQPSQITLVRADESRLRIVLNNLISNAIKYNRASGEVRVAFQKKAGQIVVSVADTGLGIPEEQKTKMFQKFFRVANSDRKNITGTGLGMYITKRYVSDMNGKIWFDSQHGKGTTFYFSLFLAENQSPKI